MHQTSLAALGILMCSNSLAIEPFIPLTGQETGANLNEQTRPFVLPSGWTQQKITDINTLNGPNFFNGTFPVTSQWWDQIDVGRNNPDLVFWVQEFPVGGSVLRYDRGNDSVTFLLQGNVTANFSNDPATWSHLSDDFGSLDPAVFTPWGTFLTAEEFAGRGRLFELSNPETATGVNDAQWNWRSNIPSVSHEGLKFDTAGNMFFGDEDASGSIYKFVPKTPGDLSIGQTFVLDVAAFAGNADEATDSAVNSGQARTGAAAWSPITDADGNALTAADPFDFTSRGGRAAADEVDATPYGRPEDFEIKMLASGNLGLFFAATDEATVYSIELDGNGTDTFVREFVNALNTPMTGSDEPIGTEFANGFISPDNLAVDPDGDMFILEDSNPGDIWLAKDSDNDGVAESLSLFARLAVAGSEPTGFVFDPNGGYLVNISHPSSGNDALWSIRPVPVPAVSWLFASGLIAGLGWMKRRA